MITAQSDWGYFAGGTIHIICSSHNDIAWFDTPAATIAWRDEKSISPALDRMAKKPEVRFSMENVLYLLEYLERHPERKAEIHQLVIDRRFDWGATYNQPYESLLSGEQLVRQTYLGRKLVEKLLPGADARVYYSPDVPGRAMQMPQILAKSGVPYMLISRHRPSLHHWYSPDGSRVLSWSMGQYGMTQLFRRELDGPLPEVIEKVQAELDQWHDDYAQRAMPKEFAFLYSMDYIPPKDFDALIEAWQQQRQQDPDMPDLRYSTPEQFFDAVAAAEPNLITHCGERPNVWLYIHGPAHHHAITAKREAGVLLPAAEAFHTVNALLHGSFAGYPEHQIAQAWANSLYDDHGWGGNNGHITDQVFREKLEAARDQSRDLLDDALQAITQRIQAASEQSVVVYNALSWPRTDPVQCTIRAPFSAFHIVDNDGNTVPHQLRSAGNGVDLDICFVAQDVPSIGYKTYSVVVDDAPVNKQPPASVQISDDSYENAFYRVKLAPGGIGSLLDKTLDQEVFHTAKFLGAEVFMLESVGNGAGEFGSIQQPSAEADFERASKHQPRWHITDSGPVYTTYTLQQEMRHCLLVQNLIFYHDIKRVDCEVSLYNWDGTRSREFRLALPINQRDAQVAYEVPMGVVEVGKSEVEGRVTDGPVYWGYIDESSEYHGGSQVGIYREGPAYLDICKDIHPREVLNFASTSDANFGFTMSSSVAVFDYIDPTRSPAPYPVLQPVLLASRKSCHGKGNWYVQPGDHHFRFSLLAHESGWSNGMRYGMQANHELIAISGVTAALGADLPGELSFAAVSDNNVLISALKKAEDNDSVVLRCYEIEGRDAQPQFSFHFPIGTITRTNLVEEPLQPLETGRDGWQAAVGHLAIETFNLTPG